MSYKIMFSSGNTFKLFFQDHTLCVFYTHWVSERNTEGQPDYCKSPLDSSIVSNQAPNPNALPLTFTQI